MTITIPEYLLLFGIGVLNIWAAVILAGIRARTAREDNRPMPIDQPARVQAPRKETVTPLKAAPRETASA